MIRYVKDFSAERPGYASRQSGHPKSIYGHQMQPASESIHLQ